MNSGEVNPGRMFLRRYLMGVLLVNAGLCFWGLRPDLIGFYLMLWVGIPVNFILWLVGIIWLGWSYRQKKGLPYFKWVCLVTGWPLLMLLIAFKAIALFAVHRGC